MAAFHTWLMQGESLHYNHVMFHFISPAVVAPQFSVAGRWPVGHNMDISYAFMFDFSRVISKVRIFFLIKQNANLELVWTGSDNHTSVCEMSSFK